MEEGRTLRLIAVEDDHCGIVRIVLATSRNDCQHLGTVVVVNEESSFQCGCHQDLLSLRGTMSNHDSCSELLIESIARRYYN